MGSEKPENSACNRPVNCYLRQPVFRKFMSRICELTGKRPTKGSIIWRSGKSKKSGGIGTHITAITKRKFHVNLQRVKAQLPSGEVRYIRVAATALKKGLVVKAPKRTWKKEDTAKVAKVVKKA
jgi:large subunit ribosomal protein L28